MGCHCGQRIKHFVGLDQAIVGIAVAPMVANVPFGDNGFQPLFLQGPGGLDRAQGEMLAFWVIQALGIDMGHHAIDAAHLGWGVKFA